MRELGRRVRRARLHHKLTQVDLSRRVGKSHGWLSALENGIGNPPAEVIVALAVALDEDPEEYLRLAGRVSLRSEDLTPIHVGALPPEYAAAIERGVTAALGPMMDRLEALIAQLEGGRDAAASAGERP